MTSITLDDLTEIIPGEKRAWLDRKGKEGFIIGSNWMHERWRDRGFLYLANFIPPTLIDAYVKRYESDNGAGARTGYRPGTPYMEVHEIKDVCLYVPLVDLLGGIIGEPVGMNLNLTNWVSTERSFHQDDYLNPEHVNGHYIAVWIALEDIHPDSGPFEFVPGSHKWPVMRMEKVLAQLEPHERTDPNWPFIAEKFIDPLYEAEIERLGAEIESIDMKKGDVLIWHAWLVHRGSKPNNPDLLRKSLICHYSGVKHRPDMGEPVMYENEATNSKGYFFPF